MATTPKKKIPLARLMRGGIRFQIFLLVTLILLPLAALLGWIYKERYEVRRDHALQSELEVAQGLAVTFQAYLDGIRKQSLSVGDAITLLPLAEDDKITQLLSSAERHSDSVRNFSWVSPEGVVLASSTPSMIGINLSDRGYFRDAQKGWELSLGDITEKGAVTERPTVAVATAIRDRIGTLKGVVVVAIEPTRLHEVALTQKRSEGGGLALFDSRGSLVYHNFFQAPAWSQRTGWLQMDSVLRKVLQTGQPAAAIQALNLPTARQWVSARVPIAGTRWVAGAGRSKQSAFASIINGMIYDALMGAAVFAVALMLAYLLGRNISAPLLRLQMDSQAMMAGNPIAREDHCAPEEVRSLRQTIVTMSSELLGRAAQLQESEESLRSVIDNVYDAIAIHDAQGRFVDVNVRWLEMFRLSRAELDRITVLDVSEAAAALTDVTPLWEEVLSGQSRLIEWRARRPSDNHVFDVEIFLCPIPYKGQRLIMANVRDITERKRIASALQRSRDELEQRVQERTEELARTVDNLKSETEQRLAAVDDARSKERLLIQQSRLAAMGEMMVNISHQWRQPLNLIGLIIQELAFEYRQRTLTWEKMKEGTGKAMQILNDMSQTINDFATYFSPDRARVKFSTKEVVEKALYLLEAELKELQIKVEVLSEDAECYVHGFRNEYMQVVVNVLMNARDVLRERNVPTPQIGIRIFCDHGHSVVIVTDNGGGIAPEVFDKIFDPYFTTKGPEQGTGIGLFMSKNIIEKSMGGTLTVKNGEEGAEFRIEV